MPKIKLALYNHPFKVGIETIRSTKTKINTGWIPANDLFIELVDLGDQSLNEKDEMLVFKALRNVLAKHTAFPISFCENVGFAKGNPDGIGNDALSETRLFIHKNDALKALCTDLIQALKQLKLSRPLNLSEQLEVQNTATGKMHQVPGPFLAIARFPINEEIHQNQISAATTLAFFLSKFTISTPVTNIVLDPEFGGQPFLFSLQNKPQNKNEMSSETATSTAGIAGAAYPEEKEKSEKRKQNAGGKGSSEQPNLLQLEEGMAINLDALASSSAKTGSAQNGMGSNSIGNTLQQIRFARSIEITNQLVNCIIEINEDDAEEYRKKMSEIIALTQRSEYNPALLFAPEKLTPMQIAQRLMKQKTFEKLAQINAAKLGIADDVKSIAEGDASQSAKVAAQSNPPNAAVSTMDGLEPLPIIPGDIMGSVDDLQAASKTPNASPKAKDASLQPNQQNQSKSSPSEEECQRLYKNAESAVRIAKKSADPLEADRLITMNYASLRLRQMKPVGKLSDEEYQSGMTLIQSEIERIRGKEKARADAAAVGMILPAVRPRSN